MYPPNTTSPLQIQSLTDIVPPCTLLAIGIQSLAGIIPLLQNSPCDIVLPYGYSSPASPLAIPCGYCSPIIKVSALKSNPLRVLFPHCKTLLAIFPIPYGYCSPTAKFPLRTTYLIPYGYCSPIIKVSALKSNPLRILFSKFSHPRGHPRGRSLKGGTLSVGDRRIPQR